MNETLTTYSLTGTKLLRCYWDQSALLQGEWNVPLLGKYEGLSIDSLINDPHKEGIILMHWDMFNEYAKFLKTIEKKLQLTTENVVLQFTNILKTK